MKLSFKAFIIFSAVALSQGSVASRITDMPRDPRSGSACMAHTTADTAGRCPAPRFAAENKLTRPATATARSTINSTARNAWPFAQP